MRLTFSQKGNRTGFTGLISIFTFIATIFISMHCYAEEDPLSNIQIIPPTPEAANFMRYGEIPVDYSTGVPNISIPIHTLELGDIKIPLSISYHASGIKVEDISSEVGLGWVLNAGGLISQTILGTDDYDEVDATINHYAFSEEQVEDLIGDYYDDMQKCLYWMANNGQESQSDRFYFSYPGNSGVFRYGCRNESDGNNDSYPILTDSIIMLPYQPIKVETDDDIETYGHISKADFGYRITDENGIIYIYSHYEGSQVNNIDMHTTCKLTKIISANLQDTITFKYSKYDSYRTVSISQWFILHSNICSSFWDEANPGIQTVTQYYPPLLTSIESRSFNVDFSYKDSPDIREYRLDSISIYYKDANNPVKQVVFDNNHYFGNTADNNQRLKLNSVSIYGEPGSGAETYSFFYNEDNNLPAYTSSPDSPKNTDYWGYFNNANDDWAIPEGVFLESMRDPLDDFDPADKIGDRNPDEEYMKTYVLDSIIYPTGGCTKYFFEANQGNSPTTNNILGGLRVAKIKNYPSEREDTVIKTYKYGYNEDGNAGQFVKIETDLFYGYNAHYLSEWKLSPGGLPYIDPIGTSLDTKGYNNSFLSLTLGNSCIVLYNTVTEYFGTTSNNIGKKVYTYYDLPPIIDPFGYIEEPHPKKYSPFHWDRGKVEHKLSIVETYDKEGNVVEYEDYGYTVYNTGTVHTGMNVVRMIDRTILDSDESQDWDFWNLYDYSFFNTCAITDNKKLTCLIRYKDGVHDTTYYYYNGKGHYKPTRVEKTQSDRRLNVDSIRYSFDYTYGNTPAIDNLLDKNILVPIEKTNLKETKPYSGSYNVIGYSTTEYDSIIPYPKKAYSLYTDFRIPESSFNVSKPTKIDIIYDKYDTYGHLLQYHKPNDVYTSFIWGYNNTYPVAKVVNATNDKIVYTGFEDEMKDIQVTMGYYTTDNEKISGNKCIYNFRLESKKLPAGNYIVSFMAKGSYNVNVEGNIITPGSEWKMYTTEVYLSSAQTIEIYSGSYVDELRICPIDAQMTTYTYKPLVGMTSATGPDNVTIYYGYDSFGRLETVKDKEGKILKNYEYHYAQ